MGAFSTSAANLNIHLHCLVLDGVYRHKAEGTPEFVEVPAPTDEALQAVLYKIITRTVVPQEPVPAAQAAPAAECEANCEHHRPARMGWAKLLRRVFEIDLEHCPNCGGDLKIIAAILEQPVIEKILTYLGLQARAPPRAPARGSQLQAA